jgi:hypothetical protein
LKLNIQCPSMLKLDVILPYNINKLDGLDELKWMIFDDYKAGVQVQQMAQHTLIHIVMYITSTSCGGS